MITLPVIDGFRWTSYDYLKYDDFILNSQVSACRDTYLTLQVPKITFKYIQSPDLLDCEDNCKELCEALRVQEHRVEICNEAFYTTRIEGAKTTRQRTAAIHDGSTVDPNNFKSEKMVLNSFNATKLLNLYQGKLSHDILYKTWCAMIEDVCDNEEIRGDRYRDGEVYVGNTTGLSSRDLEDIMSDWISYFLSSDDNDRPFFKASLLHYSFERIHPFCDGNGRMGRLLMHYYLIYNFSEVIKGVSFTSEIGKDLNDYYAALSLSSNVFNDSTPAIYYMMMHMNLTLSRVYILQNTDWSDRALDMFMTKPMYTKFQCDKFLDKIKTLL